MLSIGHTYKKMKWCKFCKKICKTDVLTHIKECEKAPEGKKGAFDYIVASTLPCVEKDWKDFIERKFEPHDFRKRWENVQCPFCFMHCKDIFHTFVCPSTPQDRKEVNKKIAFWGK